MFDDKTIPLTPIDAFNENNLTASALIHKQKMWDKTRYTEEPPVKIVDYYKNLLASAYDGSVSSSILVSSFYGAGFPLPAQTAIFGFCFILLQAFASSTQKFLLQNNDLEIQKREMKREFWEYENYPEGEKAEMVEIYVKKGLTKEQAVNLVESLSSNTNNFIETMMVEELGMLPPNPLESPFIHGCNSFLGYLAGGLVPVITYIFFARSNFNLSNNQIFRTTTTINSLFLFTLGSLYSAYSTRKWYTTGFFAVLQCGVASTLSYYLGGFLSQIRNC